VRGPDSISSRSSRLIRYTSSWLVPAPWFVGHLRVDVNRQTVHGADPTLERAARHPARDLVERGTIRHNQRPALPCQQPTRASTSGAGASPSTSAVASRLTRNFCNMSPVWL
jgi:hypothetical protein